MHCKYVAAGLCLATLVAGCGGGGGGDSGSSATSPATETVSCATDVWINNRFNCLSEGQRIINSAGGEPAGMEDMSFTVSQLVLDANFVNVLGPNKSRHFESLVCVLNAPASYQHAGLQTTSLAANLGVAFKIDNGSPKPSGIASTNLTVLPNTASATPIRCDAAVHAVVLDYKTGTVASVNKQVLPSVKVVDQ